MRVLRDAQQLLEPVVAEVVGKLSLSPEDVAAAALAVRYAAEIDAAENRGEAMEKLGPKLLTTLEALGATPAARARLKGGATSRAENRLAALRAARGA